MARNAKAKVSRTKKNYGIDLSSNIEIPKIDDFSTRTEFNEWKNHHVSFTNRNNLTYQYKKNKYDVVASKKEINKITRDTKKAQTIAQNLINKQEDKPFIQGGKQYGTVGDRTRHMSAPDVTGIHVPKDFKFEDVRNKGRLDTLKESREKRATPEHYDNKMEDMKNNFISILEQSFNSNADELVDKLKDVNPHDFYDMYTRFSEFDFKLFDSEGEDVMASLGEIERMIGYVDKYKAGEYNQDLKGF